VAERSVLRCRAICFLSFDHLYKGILVVAHRVSLMISIVEREFAAWRVYKRCFSLSLLLANVLSIMRIMTVFPVGSIRFGAIK
jgi:hypothetical protein